MNKIPRMLCKSSVSLFHMVCVSFCWCLFTYPVMMRASNGHWYQPTRIAEKPDNKWRWGCGLIATLIYFWIECTFFNNRHCLWKLFITYSYVPEIPLLEICACIYQKTGTVMFKQHCLKCFKYAHNSNVHQQKKG